MRPTFGHKFGTTSIAEQRLASLKRALLRMDRSFSPERAAEALANSHNGRQFLIRVIRSKEPPEVRRAAAYGFVYGELQSSEFNALLGVFVNANEESAVRGQIAEALGPRINFSRRNRLRRRDWIARSAFVRGLDDPSPEVRFWSIFALARPGNEWVIPKLESMTSDRTPVPGFWTLGQEASWAIHWINGEDLDPHSL
jgi:hypothetical protein